MHAPSRTDLEAFVAAVGLVTIAVIIGACGPTDRTPVLPPTVPATVGLPVPPAEDDATASVLIAYAAHALRDAYPVAACTDPDPVYAVRPDGTRVIGATCDSGDPDAPAAYYTGDPGGTVYRLSVH